MKDKDLNQIAAVEKAIAEKYGADAIQNPRASWDKEKEEEYLKQMREFYQKTKKHEQAQEKVDIDGIKVSKRLLNRESLKSCPVCNCLPKTAIDEVCFIKYECCYVCYGNYIIGREERWFNGWRPNDEKNKNT